MTEPGQGTTVAPTTAVEELIRTLVKAVRAFQMYLPNNPMYQRATHNIRAAFQPVWALTDELILTVAETDFQWDEQVVYHQVNKNESFAWSLFKDGMRVLSLSKGVEEEEIVRFLEIVQRARALPADAGDDLLTLLWEQEFHLVRYRFTEFFSDAPLPGAEVGQGGSALSEAEQEAAAEEKRRAVQEESPPQRPGVLALEDFDSTLYWLDEAEIKYITSAVEREYQQDLQANTLAILCDLLEVQQGESDRDEILTILEHLLPHLLNASDLKSVAMILRETRMILGRAPVLTEQQRNRLQAFGIQMSDPVVLGQLLQAVDEATVPPSEAELGELFGELRPSALETILVWMPKLSSVRVRELLEGAAERLADGNPRQVLELLRSPTSEALVSTITLCRRLKLQPSVPGLGDCLSHGEATVRLAAVQALAVIGTAGALAQLERGVEDPDRDVRLAAVREVGKRGYKGALKSIEPVVQGRVARQIDLTERMAFFEAYALVAGSAALNQLAALLSPGGLFRHREPPEVRACAALAVGKIRTPEARELLERAASDKDLVVRNAASRALRDTSQ